MSYIAGNYDVCVVGAGHAGCEAALACARMGKKTILFCINLDQIANMACNPSIGGTAKGHLVREVDALGGEIGKNTDKTFIQSKMLNGAKGPAVHSIRTQVDRRSYQNAMKFTIENEDNLHLKQAEITKILVEDKKVIGVETSIGAIFKSKITILTTGTYLKGRIIIGDVNYEGGPDGVFAATRLSGSLKENGISLIRLKTGTPARINAKSIDFSKMERQDGDNEIQYLSFDNEDKKLDFEQIPCYLAYTTEETKKIIEENLHRSPLFSGTIEGVGPRYCPSIEDKIVRFKDKERHQVFVEPMGKDTLEMYLQGMSSSLPEDVQYKMVRTIKGLENFEMMRTAYAIEYDAIDPSETKLSLESKVIDNLFSAGQINGSSGYEEAAAQGIMAGINASLKLDGKEAIILDRSQAYIGVLIDDLVTKGTKEPYRMMTSRAEYRLVLRQDNADERLMPIGYEIGLLSKDRYDKMKEKYKIINDEIERLKNTHVGPTEEVVDLLNKYNSTPIKSGISLSELLKRPELGYDKLESIDKERPDLTSAIKYSVENRIKYEGYIARQQKQVTQFKKMENRKIPNDIDYDLISGLRIEARQKLKKINPASIGQAMRISGVSPADVNVLLIYMQQQKGDKNDTF